VPMCRGKHSSYLKVVSPEACGKTCDGGAVTRLPVDAGDALGLHDVYIAGELFACPGGRGTSAEVTGATSDRVCRSERPGWCYRPDGVAAVGCGARAGFVTHRACGVCHKVRPKQRAVAA
jgi:hypothetical protein